MFPYADQGYCGTYTIRGVFVTLHPKNVGLEFHPPLMKPLVDGTAGMRSGTLC